ncbi:hypothetical protein AAFC00_001386 [Neodothiora populina]|uniref:ER-golgi trafficking TRAPP I complex 85 kDa subunit-domain-containing protein n=1 Tax=Neodothiora populina TaxID=2781224 RepID=A0ABR3PNS5_9PEZI
MTSSPAHPLQSPQQSISDSPLSLPRARRADAKSPLTSLNLPYRRSNTSLSNLFASTTSLPGTNVSSASGPATPTAGVVQGSVFSPRDSASSLRSPSPGAATQSDEVRLLTLRGFVPHVSVLSSPDTEELLRHKGINGGLLELLRPFGERVSGRVVIRDSTGASRPWDDFGIRFTGVKDGLESPRLATQPAQTATVSDIVPEYRPARLRTGGDVSQIDEDVERHLAHAEWQQDAAQDYLNFKDKARDPTKISPFYALYLRRLLCGMPLTPHETFSHPVALVIAISSRNPAPIEELRNLYTGSNTGEYRLPQYVNNEFLRYYVLIHDEDYDDIKKSSSLFEQMKRHFGLHCHLLRLKSNQCLPSDDDSMPLPQCEWVSAAEELAEIADREAMEDEDDPMPYIFESDAASVRTFVREMVTQSIIPGMERASATWNDQVASRRRGISGRFMSLSKRFTPFAGRSASGPATPGSNYDVVRGSYKPDTPEAVLRKLADYAFMLRDFKLAQSTYDLLCTDFKNDKAWKYYAGANEMAALTTLMSVPHIATRLRVETIDQQLENAYHSYLMRCNAGYHALRTLALCAELLRLRSGSALDDAARWGCRIIDDGLVGPTGHALVMERIASCYSARQGSANGQGGGRSRKAAFWNTLAADAWLKLEKPKQAEQRLANAVQLYSGTDAEPLAFEGMNSFIQTLQRTIQDSKPAWQRNDGNNSDDGTTTLVETMEQVSLEHRSPRKSMSGVAPSLQSFDPLGAVPVSPSSPLMERPNPAVDGFE